MKEIHKTISLNIAGAFWVVVFLVLAATGNCSVCGLDTDYVQEWGAQK